MTRDLRSPRTAIVIVALILVACEPASQTQVGGGALASGPWSAWAFAGGGDLGVCLEIRAAGRALDRLCGLQAGDTGSWQPDAPMGEAMFLAGATGDPSAMGARVLFADGTEQVTNIVPATDVSDVRFFVMVLEADADARHVEILDDSIEVLTTLQLD